LPAPTPGVPAGTPTTEAARQPPRAPSKPHRFKFFRAGGLDQVALESGDDLLALEGLDQKLWVALSCPVKGLELDERTLALLDTDGDGRVRVPEVLAAIRFCAARLRDVGVLLYGADEVALDALREDTPEGRGALGAARHVLARVGRADARAIRVEDVRDTAKVFEQTLFNGDGVVPPEAAGDDLEARGVVLDAMATLGALPDRGGRPGVDRARVTAFFDALAAYASWWDRGQAGAGILPLGDATPAAYAALSAVREKVDDFFARCDVAAIDPRAAAALNRSEPELAALAATELSATSRELAAFPIARVAPGAALPLADGVNPAWAAAVAALRRDVVTPALGRDHDALEKAEWKELVGRFAAHEAWLATKAGHVVEKLGLPRVRAILAGPGRARVEALLAEDEAFAASADAIGDLVRLVHYHRDLATVLRNFVSFADLYDPVRSAVFQAGTLYLDARSCDLCVRVDDPNAHAAFGALSRMYLAYCDCRRPNGESMRIVAAFTQGDADYLRVGRNGVFYDRRGRDWDATVVKVIENPISIRQAFWAPYKKLLRFVEDQVARFAAAKEKQADEKLAAAATKVADTAVAGKPAAPAAAVDVGRMVGIIAALGVGVGALGTLFGGFVAGFLELDPWWAKLVALGAMVLVVSGPSMLIAWLKLRQRTLGPVLDGNGWAVNGRVHVTMTLGAALTGRASFPPGARRLLEDPYADTAAKRRRRVVWALLALAVAALVAARLLGRWPFGPAFWAP
jgi:hypothetical protein